MIPGEDIESGGSVSLLCVLQEVIDPLCALVFMLGFTPLQASLQCDSRGSRNWAVSVVEGHQDAARSLHASEA